MVRTEAPTMERPMTTTDVEHAGARRGRSARQAERLARGLESVPYLTRKLDPVQVISTEGLETIEHNADTLLVHLSDEDGAGWTVLAVDRGTRRWAVAQARRQVEAARDAYARLYADA